MIRSSGSLVKMTVVTQSFPNNFEQQMAAQQDQQSFGASMPNRQCATLPRKMGGGRMPAPMPPRRDPKTTLSVGRARAKSMVAGLEGSSIEDEMTTNTKSSSAESIHQSASSTPTQVGPGTPVQLRTASIKARPTSSRITANELEELFQRQQGEVAGQNRYSAMMCSSRFQSGTDSGAATPPSSPQKAPIVYASVAEMKRKKGNKSGTLRGKPCAIPVISTELKRTFHSTPNLATDPSASMSSLWASENGFKGHRSQDDMHSLNVSLQRLNLPPPNHPPPPPPVGQVVKVDVSRGSEYESTLKLQKKLQAKAAQAVSDEIRSSFKPATNAKLYASPQDLRNVAYRTPQSAAPSEPNTATVSHAHLASRASHCISLFPFQLKKNTANRSSSGATVSFAGMNQYAEPIRSRANDGQPNAQGAVDSTIPNIPDPDYSLSESDGEDENSVLLANNTKMNENIPVPVETSGNSNAR